MMEDPIKLLGAYSHDDTSSCLREAGFFERKHHAEHSLTCMKTDGVVVSGVATPEEVEEMHDVCRRAIKAFGDVVSASKYACVGLAFVKFPDMGE